MPLFGSTFILKTLRAPRLQLYSDNGEVLLATAKYELCLEVRVCRPALTKRYSKTTSTHRVQIAESGL